MQESASVPEFITKMEEMAKDGYKGVACNLQVADNSGNIYYQLLAPMMKRKVETPYLGCRVLDGRTSKFDWTDKMVPITELARSLNPKKGYTSNANNRQAPDHAKYDYGATQMSTGRSVRIDELIREGIAAGHKFTPQDMIDIQLDNIDVFARNMRPNIVKIAESMRRELTKEQQLNLEQALVYYRDWNGDMSEDSITGSIHMHYFMHFFKSLFHKYEPESEDQRMYISDTYAFQQTYQRLLLEVVEEGEDSHF